MARVRRLVIGALGVALVVLPLAGCSSTTTEADARRAVAAVPVPAGAALLEETSEFGPVGVRNSATASRVYALPVAVDAACVTTVRIVRAAGYGVIRFEEVSGPPVTDPEAACAADLARSRAVNHDPTLTGTTMIAFAPGVVPRNANSGFALTTSLPRPGAPFPTGCTLRVTTT